ncbi:MAG: helix-turn-helix transcriptional regulator [Pseudomonadota bacterium]
MSAKTPSHVDHQVGRRIRQARRDAKLTQEQLGNLIGLTFQQVQKYEKGVNRVSAGTLYEIAQVFELPISWFFDEPVVSRISDVNEADTSEFSDCMNLLLDLRQSSNLGPVREVLRLAGAR